MKKIGVFTSGGDAPGMNAGIRAVVRACTYYNITCVGIRRGYQGLIEDDLRSLDARSVNHILGRGGTVLKSARSEEFRTKEGRKKAFETIKKHNIDGLVCIGGNGSFTGATIFHKEFGVPTIGLPGTIDNDLYGTDYTIGYDTACNTVMEAIDKIRDTATSHNRLFFVEVMGRDSGFIALRSGLATGVIAIMLPEEEISIDELIAVLDRGAKNGKTSSIVIVAEGNGNGGAYNLAKKVTEKYAHYDTRVTILGHIQRGGSPTSFDRGLASRMGVKAVEEIMKGETNKMVGIRDDKMVLVPFEEAIFTRKEPSKEIIRVAKILSI